MNVQGAMDIFQPLLITNGLFLLHEAVRLGTVYIYIGSGSRLGEVMNFPGFSGKQLCSTPNVSPSTSSIVTKVTWN